MTKFEFDMMLRARLRPTTQYALSKALGISPSYLSDVLLGRREPGKRLLDALGLVRVVSYENKPKPRRAAQPNVPKNSIDRGIDP